MDQELVKNQSLEIIDLYRHLSREQIIKEIVDALFVSKPWLPSKYFYDDLGTELFIKITRLEEYYPTRTEISILNNLPCALFDRPDQAIIELGSGDATKIRYIFQKISRQNLASTHYYPVDISRHAIHISAGQLIDLFPQIKITGIVMDFMTQLGQLPRIDNKVYFFLGSTLGNLSLEEAVHFLSSISQTMDNNDRFFLGIDMVKDEQTLHRAYNDSQGITAQFNKNILRVINRIIKSDFDVNDFDHLAFYNRDLSRIEMHLITKHKLQVNSPFFPQPLLLDKGDTIHTENSHKFTLEKIENLLANSGLRINQVFQDKKKWFSLLEIVKL